MQLRWALALLLVAPLPGRADNSFVAKTQVYVDNDHTTVVSPLVAISRDAWKGGTLSASYVADAISSASVDVISNATKHVSELRSQVTGSIAQTVRDTHLSGSYSYSVEHDFESHNVSLGIAQDFLQRNTTLALGYNLSLDSIGRAGDRAFHRSLTVNGVTATLTQTLTPRTIAQASYAFGYDLGYEASPYRFVHIAAADANSAPFQVPETVPKERYRHAIVADLHRHFGQDSSLEGDYRLYFDSWGLVAHTAELRYLVTFKDVTLRLSERFYYQQGASFFRAHYTGNALPPFVTADRELSTFWSNIAGAKVSWRLPWLRRALALEAKVDVLYFSYLDYALLGSRLGANVEGGLAVYY